jgi:hypothetical protein
VAIGLEADLADFFVGRVNAAQPDMYRHTRKRRVTPAANPTYEYYDFDS